MKPIQIFAAAALAAVFSIPAFAQDADAVKSALRKKFPEAPIDTVRKVPYGGLYEVVGNGEIYYTDDKTTFLLVGSLIDVKSKENVTEARQRQVNAVKFENLPLESAFKIVRGNGSRKVAIFADPNCGYCKRFERDLLAITDITVYTFLFPILAADSMEKSKQVWCSSDRGQAWIDMMTKNVAPKGDGKCDTAAIDKALAFGKEKRITGTPTIIFEDGERVPGAMPIAQFEKKISGLKTSQAASTASTTPQ